VFKCSSGTTVQLQRVFKWDDLHQVQGQQVSPQRQLSEHMPHGEWILWQWLRNYRTHLSGHLHHGCNHYVQPTAIQFDHDNRASNHKQDHNRCNSYLQARTNDCDNHTSSMRQEHLDLWFRGHSFQFHGRLQHIQNCVVDGSQRKAHSSEHQRQALVLLGCHRQLDYRTEW